jgi:hypothetical protein
MGENNCGGEGVPFSVVEQSYITNTRGDEAENTTDDDAEVCELTCFNETLLEASHSPHSAHPFPLLRALALTSDCVVRVSCRKSAEMTDSADRRSNGRTARPQARGPLLGVGTTTYRVAPATAWPSLPFCILVGPAWWRVAGEIRALTRTVWVNTQSVCAVRRQSWCGYTCTAMWRLECCGVV